ncbi:MAG TPA: IPT/TIG domain-containing protein [Thermoanaerobaculia bacterium]|nr:IPT/TIG domain-containing protein [Thermoanaerobaculia bacterium]
MLRVLVTSLCLILPGSVAQAQAPSLIGVTPNSGSTAGGTEVTVSGVNLIPPCQILCPTLALTLQFGDRAAAFTIVNSTTLKAVTPPHETGTVDIVFKNGPSTIATLPNGFTYLAATEADQYEKILVPQAFSLTPGRFGSLWKSEFFVLNQSDRAVRVKGADSDIQPLGDECTRECSVRDAIPARTAFDLPLKRTPPGAPPGVILHVRKSVASSLHYSLRIRDLSRQADSAGTEIPVVREHEFRTGTVHLLNIPTDEKFRQTLRIYTPGSETGSDVRLLIYPMDSSVPIAEATLRLTRSNSEPCDSLFVCYPAYGGVAFLTESYPAIKAVSAVRIELRAAFQNLKLWAFASITNNETQQVTTSTPQ